MYGTEGIQLANNVRRDRISGEIQRIVSDIIRSDVKDPALPAMTSIVSAEVTADMSYVRLRVSTLGNAQQLQGAVEALKRASGFIRRELGARLTIRHVPQLIFEADHSIGDSIALQETLKKIHDAEARRDQQ